MPAETTAESSASEAGAGVGNRRTTANAERDSLFDRNNQDIDTDAAYLIAALESTRGWNANAKLAYDSVLQAQAAEVKEYQTHIANVNALRLQTLQAGQINADNLQKQHLAHRDISTDRTWTAINELGMSLAAKTGPQQDALMTLLAKIVADAAANGK